MPPPYLIIICLFLSSWPFTENKFIQLFQALVFWQYNLFTLGLHAALPGFLWLLYPPLLLFTPPPHILNWFSFQLNANQVFDINVYENIWKPFCHFSITFFFFYESTSDFHLWHPVWLCTWSKSLYKLHSIPFLIIFTIIC